MQQFMLPLIDSAISKPTATQPRVITRPSKESCLTVRPHTYEQKNPDLGVLKYSRQHSQNKTDIVIAKRKVYFDRSTQHVKLCIFKLLVEPFRNKDQTCKNEDA